MGSLVYDSKGRSVRRGGGVTSQGQHYILHAMRKEESRMRAQGRNGTQLYCGSVIVKLDGQRARKDNQL